MLLIFFVFCNRLNFMPIHYIMLTREMQVFQREFLNNFHQINSSPLTKSVFAGTIETIKQPYSEV